MSDPLETDPLAALRAAREDAARRISELRRSTELPPAPAVPDLRSVLSRAEEHVSELRDTAAELKAVLPTRVEAAVSRALAGSEGTSLGRQVEDLRRLALETSEAMGELSHDVREDQVGRVEDLETMVDLIAASTTAVRADVSRLEAELVETRRALAELASGASEIAGSIAALSSKLDRPLSVTMTPEGRVAAVEPDAEPIRRSPPAVPPSLPAGGPAPLPAPPSAAPSQPNARTPWRREWRTPLDARGDPK